MKKTLLTLTTGLLLFLSCNNDEDVVFTDLQNIEIAIAKFTGSKVKDLREHLIIEVSNVEELEVYKVHHDAFLYFQQELDKAIEIGDKRAEKMNEMYVAMYKYSLDNMRKDFTPTIHTILGDAPKVDGEIVIFKYFLNSDFKVINYLTEEYLLDKNSK